MTVGKHIETRRADRSMSRTRTIALAACATAITALSLGGVASAARVSAPSYPPPKNPVTPSTKPKGPFRTLTVCKQSGCKYKTIQKAVNAAKAGWTIRVRRGTYHERVLIKGSRKRYLKVIGDRKHPTRVKLSGKRAKPTSLPNNGITVNGADQVTIDGLSAFDYDGYGFFIVNNNGYRLTNLVAKRTGVYGLYAFNSVGGSMTNSVAAWNNDSGFYVGQTPPQAKPKRTLIKNVVAYGNVLGYSGTNSRYVTITKSRWYNNGLGIVPNALDSEKYAPPEDNVISDNDIFFNNFNYYAGAPFKVRPSATGTPYPIGTGILLFGGRRAIVEGNRIYGNELLGIGAIKQILLKQVDAQDLIGNQIRENSFGNDGRNLNGRDLFYDGSGHDNCVTTTGTQGNVPQSGDTFVACPANGGYTGPNTFDQAAQTVALGWALNVVEPEKNPLQVEAAWIRHPQPAVGGITPLVHWEKSQGAG